MGTNAAAGNTEPTPDPVDEAAAEVDDEEPEVEGFMQIGGAPGLPSIGGIGSIKPPTTATPPPATGGGSAQLPSKPPPTIF